jgi:hypothetical protein
MAEKGSAMIDFIAGSRHIVLTGDISGRVTTMPAPSTGIHKTSKNNRILQVEDLKDMDGGSAGGLWYLEFDGATQTFSNCDQDCAEEILRHEKAVNGQVGYSLGGKGKTGING